MKLEQQVCNLELAQKLKELGVKQESIFSYERYVIEKHNPEIPVIHYHAGYTTRVKQQYASNLYFVSAFTVAELGEILKGFKLPDFIPEKGYRFKWFPEKDTFCLTEADARASLLIKLIENKSIIL